MNFIKFEVSSTNIFPAVNSETGGALLTEFNIRSRESISTPQNVPYMIGPSYTHSENDFRIDVPVDGEGVPVSTSIIQISEGRALVNGHYIESLAPIQIDLVEVNTYLVNQDPPIEPMYGKLCIGLRAMYSTQANIAAALRVENAQGFYEGIQVVILPEDQFKLPQDPDAGGNYTEEDAITAHLKLGSFIFSNGAINVQSIDQNYPERCHSINADRVSNIDGIISSQYVSKTGLQPEKLYVFSGKQNHESSKDEPWVDSWCDATDSLIVWDASPELTTDPPVYKQATIEYLAGEDKTRLVLPHKQVDGMTKTDGTEKYYANRIINFPSADYEKETGGMVTKEYTQNIKRIREAINEIYKLPAGRQVAYIDVLNDIDELPSINPNWNVGDYVVVGQDNLLGAELYTSSEATRSPSTFYVVLPGLVQTLKYHSRLLRGSVPEDLTGVELSSIYMEDEPDTEDSEIYNSYFGIPSDIYRGVPNEDYFTVYHDREVVDDDPESEIPPVTFHFAYYYAVETSTERVWSSPVLITGTIPLATESVIGGFYNVSESMLDGGYVARDTEGHLRLLDYDLLRTGVLAYQLGEDFSAGSGLSVAEMQIQLDDYVNNRVAFPNAAKIEQSLDDGTDPHTIAIILDIGEEEDEVELNLENVDSRFGTAIEVSILGTATANVTINFRNCEKLRIMNNIAGSPTINIYNCCLYYDSVVMDSLNIIEDLTLWYKKYLDTDPNLLIDGMNVISMDPPSVSEEVDYWSTEVPNDNHYSTSLRNVRFGNDGTIIGLGLYVKNNVTENVMQGKSIFAGQYVVPQGGGLTYPMTCMTSPVKIDGQFITAYKGDADGNWYLINTSFTALSQTYDATSIEEDITKKYKAGTISFFSDSTIIDNIITPADVIDGWNPNTYHEFQGGVIGGSTT